MSGILQRQQFPSTFLLFNYRAAASLWQQRDDDSQAARLDEAASAWIRHSRHFLRSSHYENCVRAYVRVCVCACTFRFVTSVPLLLADLTIYTPPSSSPSLFLERKPKRNPPPLFSRTKSRHFLKGRIFPEVSSSFFFSFFFLFCAIDVAICYILFHWRNGFEKRESVLSSSVETFLFYYYIGKKIFLF